MKKGFKFYVLTWLVLVALFNVIAFVSVGWKGIEKYTPAFWIGYVFISVSFIGQMLCSFVAFSAKSANKLFYNISLAKTSYAALIVSFIVGGLCMLISPLPEWIGILICAIILAVQILAVLKAAAVSDIVSGIDDKIKTKTFFIKYLTADAETLMASAKSVAVKAECKKVYEAIRYSDPMSNNVLAPVESQIATKFKEFSDVVKMDDAEKAVEIGNEVVVLVGDRNKKCKLLK